MPVWDVEFIGHVYVTLRVAADNEDTARETADKLLPRYPVVANTITAFGPDVISRAVNVGKDWEINDVSEVDGS